MEMKVEYIFRDGISNLKIQFLSNVSLLSNKNLSFIYNECSDQ
jgi:hypothetical protein